MVKIQTNLINFSVANELIALFSNYGQGYGITIEKGRILPDLFFCPLCGCRLSKNGYNKCKDKKAKAFGLRVKKGRLICSNPDCQFAINIPQSVLKNWFSKLLDLIKSNILSLGTKKLSSDKIAQHLKETLGLSFSGEYIRLKFKELTEKIKQPSPSEKPSGVVIHDEQFVKIKGVDLKRISTLDANNSNVYHDKLHPDRTEETMTDICHELKKTLKEIYAAVMDGLSASKKAYQKVFVGILIQYCLFHFAQNVKDAYKDEVGYGKYKTMLPLQHLIGFFSILNILFDHDRELIELRCLQKELNEHIERINKADYPLIKKEEYIEDLKKAYDYKAAKYLRKIRKIRRRKNGLKLILRTEEQAKKLLEKAKVENVFPKNVQKQIDRLEREWKNFTHCMRDKNIPPTTNKVEQYYALTLNWIEKNNLQSEEQFYREQKFSLMRRYNLPLIKPGIFSEFLKTTFVMLLTFGGT
jgi:hypothetical protein